MNLPNSSINNMIVRLEYYKNLCHCTNSFFMNPTIAYLLYEWIQKPLKTQMWQCQYSLMNAMFKSSSSSSICLFFLHKFLNVHTSVKSGKYTGKSSAITFHLPMSEIRKVTRTGLTAASGAKKVEGEKRGGPEWCNITNIRLFTKQNMTLGHFVWFLYTDLWWVNYLVGWKLCYLRWSLLPILPRGKVTIHTPETECSHSKKKKKKKKDFS